MSARDRVRLLFGPYRAPRLRRGARLGEGSAVRSTL
jgi:hypothetical protein